MEELLNKLIQRGWKPRGNGKEIGKFIVRKRGRSIEKPQSQCMIYFYDKDDCCFMAYSLRELVSKESGLWQFCCRNKLVYGVPEWSKTCEGVVRENKQSGSSHYRIIESSLIDEDELEKFLLENIKI